PRDIRIGELERGEVFGDGIVPRHFAGIDEQREGGRRERLRGRADGEEGVRIDAGGLPELPDAVALGEYHGVVPYDGDRHTGNAPVAERLVDVRVEPAERGILRPGQAGDRAHDPQ